jgi:hypothetical protein
MKFFFLEGKRHNAIYGEPRGVLGEAGASLATVKRRLQCFKPENSSLDDANRPGRPLNGRAQVISQFLRDKPFLSARVLTKRVSASRHTIEEIISRGLGMRKLT